MLGAQKWKGAAVILKSKLKKIKKIESNKIKS